MYFEKEWFDALDVTEYDSVYICGYEIEGDGGDQIIDFLEKTETLIYIMHRVQESPIFPEKSITGL